MENNVKVIVGIVLTVLALFSSGVLKWQIDKDYITLYSDDTIIAKEKWIIEAERTYFNLDTWYDKNVKCPKVVTLGGHITATRCYYPDGYYEQLSRSLINTKISYTESLTSYIVKKESPNYKYGTVGSYAGYIIETLVFDKKTDKEEEFPNKYFVNWNPTDTRNYKLTWRIENLKEVNLPDGDYNLCKYNFGRIKIDLKEDCSKLIKATIKDNSKIYFYFKSIRGEQNFNVQLVDPIVEGISLPDSCDGTTYYINSGTLQAKVLDNATIINGDVIVINASISDSDINISKSLCILGQNLANMSSLIVSADNVTIYDYEITSGLADFPSTDDITSIYLNAESITLKSITIVNNITASNGDASSETGGDAYGIYISSGKDNHILENITFKSVIGGNGYYDEDDNGNNGGNGILIYNNNQAENVQITNLVFANITCGDGSNGGASKLGLASGGSGGYTGLIYGFSGNLTIDGISQSSNIAFIGCNGGNGDRNGYNGCGIGGLDGGVKYGIDVSGSSNNLYNIHIENNTYGSDGTTDCSNSCADLGNKNNFLLIDGIFNVIENVNLHSLKSLEGSDSTNCDTSGSISCGSGGDAGNLLITFSGTSVNLTNVTFSNLEAGSGGDTECPDTKAATGGDAGYVDINLGSSSNSGTFTDINIYNISTNYGGKSSSDIDGGASCMSQQKSTKVDIFIEGTLSNVNIYDITAKNGRDGTNNANPPFGRTAGGIGNNVIIDINPLLGSSNVNIYDIVAGTGGLGYCTYLTCTDGASGDVSITLNTGASYGIYNLNISDLIGGGNASGGCSCAKTGHCGLPFVFNDLVSSNNNYSLQSTSFSGYVNVSFSNFTSNGWDKYGVTYDVDDKYWWYSFQSPTNYTRIEFPYTSIPIKWYVSSDATNVYTMQDIQDTYVDSDNPNTNYATAQYLYVDALSGEHDESYIRLDLTSIIDDHDIVKSAYLYLYRSAVEVYKKNTIYYSASDISIGGLKWSNKPNPTATLYDANFTAISGWNKIDVTKLVIAMRSSDVGYIRITRSNTSGSLAFDSMEYTTEYLRPYFVVDYVINSTNEFEIYTGNNKANLNTEVITGNVSDYCNNVECNYTWDVSSLSAGNYYLKINSTYWSRYSSENSTDVFSNSFYYLAPETDMREVFINTTYNDLYPDNILYGWCNATDYDGNTVRYDYMWFKNGVLFESGNYSSFSTEGTRINVDTLVQSNFTIGDTVILSCKAISSVGNVSFWKNSSEETILAYPIITTLSEISPNTSQRYDLVSKLEGYCKATNERSNNIYYQYTWFKDDVVYNIGNTTGNYTENTRVNVNNLTLPANDIGQWNLECNGWDKRFGIDVGTALNSSVLNIQNVSLTINGSSSNYKIEFSDSGDITLNASVIVPNEVVCLDFIHLTTDINVSCGVNSTSFILNLTDSYFRKSTISNGSSSAILTYSGGDNKTFYISSHQFDKVSNLSFNMSGSSNIRKVDVYINNTLTNKSFILEGNKIANTFYGNLTSTDIDYPNGAEYKIAYAYLEKEGTVNYASINISGKKTLYSESSTFLDNSTRTVTTDPDNDPMSQLIISRADMNITSFTLSFASDYTINVTMVAGSTRGGTEYGSCTFEINSSNTSAIISYEPYNCTLNDYVSYDSQIYIGVKTEDATYAADTNKLTWLLASTKNLRYNGYLIEGVVGGANYTGYDAIYTLNGSGYPEDVQFYVGSNTTIFNSSSGKLLSMRKIEGFLSNINDYLISCTADSYKFCNVPLIFYSNGTGNISLTSLYINISVNEVKIYLPTSTISTFLNNSINATNIPIRILSEYAGTITIDDIKYDYLGGNSTYIVRAHTADYLMNKTQNLTMFYSGWNYALPQGLDYIDWYPWSPTAKNVTPFGQSSSTAIMTITNQAYGSNKINWYMYLNNSAGSCATLYASNSSVISTKQEVDETWLEFLTNTTYLSENGIWMWVDLSCSYNDWQYWSLDYYFKVCCSDCDICVNSIN